MSDQEQEPDITGGEEEEEEEEVEEEVDGKSWITTYSNLPHMFSVHLLCSRILIPYPLFSQSRM